MKRKIPTVIISLTLFILFTIYLAADTPPPSNKAKLTTLGKYITAVEAYEMWKANPETIKILDVRTHGEYVFVGYAPMKVNIPILLLTIQWNLIPALFPM